MKHGWKGFLEGAWLAIRVIFFIFLFSFVMALIASWIENDPKYTQGESVTIISNDTVIKDGLVCQVVENANIAYTGEDGPNWWKAKPAYLVFPTMQYYVIKADGTKEWINSIYLVKYDSDKSYCSPAVQKE
jgi:hypothetical protein